MATPSSSLALPDGAIARLGYGSPQAVQYSPGGAFLAVGTSLGVELWDAQTHQRTTAYDTNAWITSVAFSPDGLTIAGGGIDNTVRLWDVVTRASVSTLYGHSRNVASVAFSPDGATLASGSLDRTVKLWDIDAGQEIATLPGHAGFVRCIAFSPDGTILASASNDGTVKLWDVAARQEAASLEGHSSYVWSVAFSPDGATLASSSNDGTVKLWDIAARQEISTLPAHSLSVESVAFSPDGATLATGSWGEVKLWDIAARQEIAALPGASYVGSVAYSSDGATLASGAWAEVKLWDVVARQELATLLGHSSAVGSVAFSPDDTTLASGGGWTNHTVRLWDVAAQEEIVVLGAHAGVVNGVAFSPDGATLASASDDGTMKLWDVASRREIATLQGHSSAIESVAFSPDGNILASGSTDRTVKLWDVGSRQEIATLTGHINWVFTIAFSPDGGTLASGSYQRIKLWDIATRSEIATLRGHTSHVNATAFSPDGVTLASAGQDATLVLWDMSPYVASPALAQRSGWVFEPGGDGTARPGERVQFRTRMQNQGDGGASRVNATLTVNDSDVAVVRGEVAHAFWPAGEARNNVGFVLDIAPDATPHDVTVLVDVTADNGGPWQFTYTFPIAAPPPGLAARSFWARDKVTGNADGDTNPGERVEIKARVKNESETEFQNVVVTLSSDDDVTIVNGTVNHAAWPAGVARNNGGLVGDIGAEATDSVAFTLDITADNGGPWRLSYTLPIVPLPVTFTARSLWARDKATGNADGDANPGERVEIRARLRNDSAVDAQNVVVTLSSADDVTIVNGTVNHATWPGGVARNNNGLLVDIGSGASGSVAFTVDVTSDSGGPWQFTYTLPIVALPAGLVARSFWARDKVTGNADGDANAGERVEIKARVKNESATDLVNVVATLSSDDPDVTVVNGQVTHETWPAGVARNNDGPRIDIGSSATDSVALTLDITADNGGPWQFTYTLPVVAAPVVMSARSFWMRDKSTGNADGDANPGERVELKARMKNASSVDAENVVVTLSSTDDVTIVNRQITHATWPAGVARNNNGLVVEIGAGATESVTFTIDVTADNGGPWQFTYTLPVVATPAEFAMRSTWARGKTTGDADGQVEPGERVELRVRLKNNGQTTAENVVVLLGTADANVTVAADTVTHATWPGGVARNNAGFLIDLGAEASSPITFVVDVTADNAGPWQFTFELAVDLPTAPTALAAPEDVNLDGVVGIRDILTVAPLHGQRSSALPSADINGDRVLDLSDMIAIESARTDVLVGAPSARRSSVGLVERWLAESRQADDGSQVFRRGMAALEDLLATLRPSDTALLPNYPNPFNPETWIPFDLSADADVTIRVYDAQGREVRRMALGRLDVGAYRGRTHAAYWDGRNELGEPAASGVYFYELRAGDIVQRRRMVIRK